MYEPAVILPAVCYIINIDGVIYDLEDQHIPLLKQDKTVRIPGDIFTRKPRASLRHCLERIRCFFKFGGQPFCCFGAYLRQKSGMGNKHLCCPLGYNYAIFILIFHDLLPP